MLPKRKYTGRIPIRQKTVPGGTARATGGRYPGKIPIRQRTVPGRTARPTGGRYPGAAIGTIKARPTIRPAGQYPGAITLKPRPTPTLTPRPITTITSIVPTPKAPGHYPAAIPMVATGPVTGGAILPTANGLGIPAISGGSLSGIGNSISTGVGGILSVGRSYVPLAIKAVAILIVIKIALWIFRRK